MASKSLKGTHTEGRRRGEANAPYGAPSRFNRL